MSVPDERYSPFPVPLGRAPTLEELEQVRQAALLYIQPTNPDDNAAQVHLAQVLTMTIQGAGEKDIAERLGITRGQVRVARRALRERKLLDDSLQNAVDRLKNEAVPLAVDATIKAIEDGDAKTRDRVLDTFGLGPSKGAAAGSNDAPLVPQIPALTLNFTLPPGVTVERANKVPESGKVIGRGKDQPRIQPATDEDRDHAIEMPSPDGSNPAI